VRALALLLTAGLLAGCGGSTRNVVSGGAVPGTTRTVYSLLPNPGEGAARDMVLGQKLAIQQAGGRAGGFALSFVSLDESTADPGLVSERAAAVTFQAIRDPQVIAIFGGASSQAAMISVPLIDAAGILHLLPGAGYPGFTRAWAPGEPAKWLPSGSARNLKRLVPDDTEQAKALVAAAERAAGGGPTGGGLRQPLRIAVEQEPSDAAGALATAVGRAAEEVGARIVDSTAAADAVVYAGSDVPTAVAAARDVTAAGTPIVLPDDLVRAGVAERLDPRTRRRTALVSGAPAPHGPEVRALAPAFRAAFGRDPGPYAVLGYESMKAVVAALDRVGPRERRRQAVTAAFRPPPPHGFAAYRADGRALDTLGT
jgi:branched-chain amino acid transport system substrate-binding protein